MDHDEADLPALSRSLLAQNDWCQTGEYYDSQTKV